ncbi:MAG: pentapeptide repeat-containing protein [Armatimonadetes bacterium]|nr:pentapeptide repeat-containing protein [Armatimonadota bacterium]
MAAYSLRELLELITANGGPRGLDLSRADLRGLDAGPEALAAERARLGEAGSVETPVWLVAETGGLDLSEASLDRATLAGARLTGARLVGAYLGRADLSGSRCEGADFSQADLERAQLGGANLEGANLEGASLDRAQLAGANLRRARLEGASLERSHLADADLREADLRGACLERANLEGADLRGANTEGADFSRANLKGVTGEDVFAELNRGLSTGLPLGVVLPQISGDLAKHGARLAEMAGQLASQARPGAVYARDAARAARDAVRAARDAARTARDAETVPAEFTREIPLEGATALRVLLKVGNLRVVPGEADAVLLQGRAIDPDTLTIAREGEVLSVRQEGPDVPRRHAALALTVPASLARLDAGTGVGNVHLAAAARSVRAHTGCGNLKIEAPEAESLDANTGVGNIHLRGTRLQHLSVHTGAGNIDADAALAEGEHGLQSGVGNVTLALPGDAAAQVEAVTGIGAVKSDWPLVQVGRHGPRAVGSQRMVGGFGEESRRARVKLGTGAGEVRLRRAAPGAREESVPDEASAGAPEERCPESAPPEAAETTSPTGGETPPDARLKILEGLARGEITAEEVEELLFADR